jgi:hypothetical protein
MFKTLNKCSEKKQSNFPMHVPIATSDLTRGLPSEDICRRLRTTFISAFTFSSSSESSSEPFNVLSRRFPSAKTAAALTWQDKMFNMYLEK